MEKAVLQFFFSPMVSYFRQPLALGDVIAGKCGTKRKPTFHRWREQELCNRDMQVSRSLVGYGVFQRLWFPYSGSWGVSKK